MLPTEQRLRVNRDFRRAYNQGRSHVTGIAVLYLYRRTDVGTGEAPGRRIGFVVSKKQGKSVARNRIKRRLRDAVRRRLPDLRPGPFDLIFVGRGRAKSASWPEVEAAVDDLLRRAGLFAPGMAGRQTIPAVPQASSELSSGEASRR